MHRAKRIADGFKFWSERITKNFLSAAFTKNFFRNTIESFNKNKTNYIIPKWLFDERKLIQTKNLQKALSKSVLYLQIINVNSAFFGTLETLHSSFKLKIKPKTIAAWFMKVIVCVVKPMSVNLWEMLF